MHPPGSCPATLPFRCTEAGASSLPARIRVRSPALECPRRTPCSNSGPRCYSGRRVSDSRHPAARQAATLRTPILTGPRAHVVLMTTGRGPVSRPAGMPWGPPPGVQRSKPGLVLPSPSWAMDSFCGRASVYHSAGKALDWLLPRAFDT